MENELVETFDAAILALREKAKSMKDAENIGKAISGLDKKRPALVKALEEGDEEKADIILAEVISVGQKLDQKKEKEGKGLLGFLGFGKKKEGPKKEAQPKAEEPKKEPEPKNEALAEPKPPKPLPKKEEAKKPVPPAMKASPKKMRAYPKKEEWLRPRPEDFKPVPVVVKEPKPIKEVPREDMKVVEAEMRKLHEEQALEIGELRAQLKGALAMQKELGSVQRRLADSDLALDGVRGEYSGLRKQVAAMRGGFTQRQPADTGHLAQEVRELKHQLEMMNNTMSKEMGFAKRAYSEFGLELMSVAVKLSELEHLLTEGDDVTDADIYSLKQHMILLEKKLGTLDARELKARRELVEEVKDKRSRMMRTLKKKTVSKEELGGITSDVAGLRAQVNERQARVSQELNKEMHKKLGALDKKLSLVQGALEKSSDRGLKKAHDRINGMGKELKAVQQAELRMLKELEAQQEADAEMAKRLDKLHRQVRRKGVNYDEVRRAMSALEKDIGKRGGEKAEELRSGLAATRQLLETMEGS